jgi:hypothetical protein
MGAGNNMHALMLHGRFQFYSTKALAEIEGARFIMRHLLKNYCRTSHLVRGIELPPFTQFTDAYNQERYADCLTVWNKMVDADHLLLGNIFHKAIVTPAEIDKPFF